MICTWCMSLAKFDSRVFGRICSLTPFEKHPTDTSPVPHFKQKDVRATVREKQGYTCLAPYHRDTVSEIVFG